jgi:3-oxoacyl-[acyl-carrier-protein] synthase-3
MCLRGTGHYVPANVRTNEYYTERLDTNDEWIVSRTGIRARHVVADDQTTSTLGAAASRAALEDAGIPPEDLDLILCATITGDCPFPATANFIQHELGLAGIPSFDMSAACSGFVYALVTGATFLQTGHYRNVLVIGAETLTRVVDQEDRTSCILFGDGAGAAVISPTDDVDQGIINYSMGADPEHARLIWMPAGGASEPASHKTVNERLHYMRMHGRDVFKYAVPKMTTLLRNTLDEAGVTIDDVAMVIPHQSNARMIESARERLGWPAEKMYVNIDRFGNTSAASVPIALDEARRDGRLEIGDLVLMLGLGAGITYGTALVRL